MTYKKLLEVRAMMVEQILSILDDPCLKSEERLEAVRILYELTRGRL